VGEIGGLFLRKERHFASLMYHSRAALEALKKPPALGALKKPRVLTLLLMGRDPSH